MAEAGLEENASCYERQPQHMEELPQEAHAQDVSALLPDSFLEALPLKSTAPPILSPNPQNKPTNFSGDHDISLTSGGIPQGGFTSPDSSYRGGYF